MNTEVLISGNDSMKLLLLIELIVHFVDKHPFPKH